MVFASPAFSSLAHPFCQGKSSSGSGNYQPHPCQSQPVAEPSSEEDYPSISISHTLVSRVSLLSFVSATRQPEEMLLIIGGWRGFSLHAREVGVSDEEGEGGKCSFHAVCSLTSAAAAITPSGECFYFFTDVEFGFSSHTNLDLLRTCCCC